MNTVLRDACDACHGRKMRCLSEGNGACANCRKTGKACVYSPRSEMGRPRLDSGGPGQQRREKRVRKGSSAIGINPVKATRAEGEQARSTGGGAGGGGEGVFMQVDENNPTGAGFGNGTEGDICGNEDKSSSSASSAWDSAWSTPQMTDDMFLLLSHVSTDHQLCTDPALLVDHFLPTTYDQPQRQHQRLSQHPLSPAPSPPNHTQDRDQKQNRPEKETENPADPYKPAHTKCYNHQRQIVEGQNPTGCAKQDEESSKWSADCLLEVYAHLSQILFSLRTSQQMLRLESTGGGAGGSRGGNGTGTGTGTGTRQVLETVFLRVSNLCDVVSWFCGDGGGGPCCASSKDKASPCLLLLASLVWTVIEIYQQAVDEFVSGNGNGAGDVGGCCISDGGRGAHSGAVTPMLDPGNAVGGGDSSSSISGSSSGLGFSSSSSSSSSVGCWPGPVATSTVGSTATPSILAQRFGTHRYMQMLSDATIMEYHLSHLQKVFSHVHQFERGPYDAHTPQRLNHLRAVLHALIADWRRIS